MTPVFFQSFANMMFWMLLIGLKSIFNSHINGEHGN